MVATILDQQRTQCSPTSGGGICVMGEEYVLSHEVHQAVAPCLAPFKMYSLSSGIIGPKLMWDQTVEMFYVEDEQEKLGQLGLRWWPFPGQGGWRWCLHRNGSESWPGLP